MVTKIKLFELDIYNKKYSEIKFINKKNSYITTKLSNNKIYKLKYLIII